MAKHRYFADLPNGETLEKHELAAEYMDVIGYDPFQDDPSITVDEVRQILREHAAERGE